MSPYPLTPIAGVDPSRRRFVQGLALGGVATAFGGTALPAAAQARRVGNFNELSGTRFDLTVGELPVNFTGRTRPAVVVNGSLPAPILRWKEGTSVELNVRNALPPGSIHGHQRRSTGTASSCRRTWTACPA